MADLVLTPTQLANRKANCSPSSACYGVPYSPIPAPDVLFTLSGRSNNYGAGRRGQQITMIVDHTTQGGSASIVNSMTYDAWRKESVSATAFVGEDGVGISVPEVDRPWTNGKWNERSLTSETVGYAAWSEQEWRAWRPKTIENKIKLFAYWCRKYKIPAVWLTADDIVAGKRGITDHYTANQAAIKQGYSASTYSHTDVGPGMRRVLQLTIIPAVKQLLESTGKEIDMNTMTIDILNPRRYSTRGGDGAPFGAAQGQGFFGFATTRFCNLGLSPEVTAAFVNLTVVAGPTAGGYLTAWGDGPQPPTSNVNFEAGKANANVALVEVVNGGINVFAKSPCDLIVDIQATFS
jgi:hypothetical protein